MSMIGFLYLVIKLLVLASLYFGLQWVCGFLGVNVPDILWKILAVILVILGVIAVLLFIGVA